MMERQPLISVIMTTYNRKELLPRAIQSVLNQTFSAFELILVNNGSTDGSQVLCEHYAASDSRIKLITIKENTGAAKGRNTGLDAAGCEYLAFVDDDDYCEPAFLDFLWNLARDHDADIAVCGSVFEIGDRIEPKFIFDETLVLNKVEALDEMLKREKFNVTPATKLFRRSLFSKIRFLKNVMIDDIHIIYKVFAEANKVAANGKPLYRFRKHEGNLTSFIQTNKLSKEILTEYLSAFRARTEFLSRHVPGITGRARYSEWSYMISMCNKIKQFNLGECDDLYNQMLQVIGENLKELKEGPYLQQKEADFLEEMNIWGQAN